MKIELEVVDIDLLISNDLYDQIQGLYKDIKRLKRKKKRNLKTCELEDLRDHRKNLKAFIRLFKYYTVHSEWDKISKYE